MKNILLLTLLLPLCVLGQTIKHHSYTTFYDAKIGEPDSVKWVLTHNMLNCTTKLARLNKFVADPLIPNTQFNKYYDGSGYDQGHQFDADDAACSTVDESECWYFTNMVPQRPNLNRITWRTLENYTRRLAATQSVNITCGVIGSLGTITGHKKKKNKGGTITVSTYPSTINIPKYCWKRLKYSGHIEYYIMPNSDTVSRHNFTYYKVK